MSIVESARASRLLSQLSPVGQNLIIPARSQISAPQDPGTKAFITPQQRLEFLDECIEDLKHRIADLVAEDADECEQLEDAADLRIFQDARYEIVYLMREVSRLRITEPQPRDYEEWIPWAYGKTRPRAPKDPTEEETDYRARMRSARAQKTPVRRSHRAQKGEHVPPSVKLPRKSPRKSQARFWLLKLVLRRFWCSISVTRSR